MPMLPCTLRQPGHAAPRRAMLRAVCSAGRACLTSPVTVQLRIAPQASFPALIRAARRPASRLQVNNRLSLACAPSPPIPPVRRKNDNFAGTAAAGPQRGLAGACGWPAPVDGGARSWGAWPRGACRGRPGLLHSHKQRGRVLRPAVRLFHPPQGSWRRSPTRPLPGAALFGAPALLPGCCF